MYQAILPLIPEGASRINDFVSVFRGERIWTYFSYSQPVYKHDSGNRLAFYLTACQMIDAGLCRECEILTVFGVPKRTLDNWQEKYRKDGISAFFKPRPRKRKGRIFTPEVLERAQKLLDEGVSRGQIATELGASASALRKAISDGRLHERKRRSGTTKSERTVRDAEAAAGMGTACTRIDERFLAAMGRLSGAKSLFQSSLSVPRGGVLCALPAMLENGLLMGVDKHLGAIHGYYTQYHILMLLGCPFFVVEKQIDGGLLAALRENIVPRLLRDVPGQPSEQELEDDPFLCRFAIVFDREGYSPEFFREMWAGYRIACLSYHKHQGDDWPPDSFAEHRVTLAHGETVGMRLAEMGTCVGSGRDGLWMREIRKLSESGHQTSIIGTVFKPPMELLAPRIFARWCQENFLGYMMEHFAIDLLMEHGNGISRNKSHYDFRDRRQIAASLKKRRKSATEKSQRFGYLT